MDKGERGAPAPHGAVIDDSNTQNKYLVFILSTFLQQLKTVGFLIAVQLSMLHHHRQSINIILLLQMNTITVPRSFKKTTHRS